MLKSCVLSRGHERLRLGTAFAALAMLSACGGGGGSAPRTAPAPAPPPPPATPTPTPGQPTPPSDPAAYNTAEFRRSDGPETHGAVEAWTRGYAGAGVTLAIVDTGIDQDNPEFAGRISSASRDVAGNGTVEAEDDHGTNVALVAAAARDNTGVLGIAWQSTILAIRADEPGTCATEDPDDEDSGCKLQDSAIADGINHAVASGAAVVNLSLGGGRTSSRVLSAVRNAAANGVIVIVSAGNDGDSTESGIDPNNPDPFAQDIRDAGGDHVIIVGSIADSGIISDFSNRAGSYRNSFLVARGERICCVYENGELFIDDEGFAFVFSGTSFAAPQVTGAVALLAQAFPNLTGAEIVALLLETARDAGASGTDALYGRGILDIAEAFQPQGTTSIAGTRERIVLSDATGSTSPAMGDASSQGAISTIITDKYDRAFGYELSGRIEQASIARRLLPALDMQGRSVSLSAGSATMAFSIADTGPTALRNTAQQLTLTEREAEQARVLAARVAFRLDPQTKVAFGFAQSADGLVAQLQGHDRPAFMIARDVGGDDGFYRREDFSFAARRQFGDWGLSLNAAFGEAQRSVRLGPAQDISARLDKDDVASFGIAADRRFGDLETALGLTWMNEDRTLLGARFHSSLGARGANTFFVDGRAGWNIAKDWRIGAAGRFGMTMPKSAGLISGGTTFQTTGWSADLRKRSVFSDRDSMAFRVAQPLRVESGGIGFNLPVDYDYSTESAIFGTRVLSLSPTGREINGELSWNGALWGGSASASIFYRSQPGHISTLPDDQGAAVRWVKKF